MLKRIGPSEFASKLMQGERDFSKVRLKTPSLKEKSVSDYLANEGSIYSGLNIECSDLRGVDLSYCSFPDIYANGSDLRYSNLSKADFSHSDFERTNFSGAIIEWADLSSSILAFSNLSYASLLGSSFNSSELYRSNLNRADLRGANLAYAHLRSASLKGANLTRADMNNTNFFSANLNGSDFTDAFLKNTGMFLTRNLAKIKNPEKADFSQARMTGEDRRCIQRVSKGEIQTLEGFLPFIQPKSPPKKTVL